MNHGKKTYMISYSDCLDHMSKNSLMIRRNITLRKKLFLIDGAAGTVKSDLIRFINTVLSPNSVIVTKYTTRPKRRNDDLVDLNFISDEEFKLIKQECFYYPYGKEDDGYGKFYYGILKKTLEDAIQKYENIFVIVRNAKVIKEIKQIYESKLKIVHIFIYSDRLCTKERLEKEA